MKIGEFFIDLLVDSEAGELSISKLVSLMGELEVASIAEIGVLIEVGKHLTSLTEAHIEEAAGIELVTMRTGASSDALQRWREEAKAAGSSASDMDDFFVKISASLTRLQHGHSGEKIHNLWSDPQLAAQMGDFMNLKAEDPFEILTKLRVPGSYFQTLSEAKQAYYMDQAGLGNMLGVAQLKNLPTELFKHTWENVSVVPPEELERLKTMHLTILDIEQEVNRISDRTIKWFGPMFQEKLDLTLKKMKEAEEFFPKAVAWFEENLDRKDDAATSYVGISQHEMWSNLNPVHALDNAVTMLDQLDTLGFLSLFGPDMAVPRTRADIPLTSRQSFGPNGITNNHNFTYFGEPTEKQRHATREQITQMKARESYWVAEGFRGAGAP